MKKTFCFCLIFIISIFSVIMVNASSGIEIFVNSTEINNNRIFPVRISALASNTNLSVASFKIIYDSEFIEYRNVSAVSGNSTVKAYDTTDKTNVIFLNSDGINVNRKSELFDINFKSVQSGTTHVYIILNEAVDSNVSNLSIKNSSITMEITINGKSITAKSYASTKSDLNKISTIENKSKKNDNNTASTSNQDSSVVLDENYAQENTQDFNKNNNFGNINQDNSVTAFFAGAGSILFIIIIAALAFYFGKKSVLKNQNKSDSDSKIQKNSTMTENPFKDTDSIVQKNSTDDSLDSSAL